jgi:hypothetical protein
MFKPVPATKSHIACCQEVGVLVTAFCPRVGVPNTSNAAPGLWGRVF